jgi:flagellar M-ring protein FliF
MASFLRDLIAQLNELLARQSLTRKIIAGVMALLVLAFLVFQIWSSFKPVEQEILYTDMNPDQAKFVIDELTRQREKDFKIEETSRGWTISVAKGRSAHWRLNMATDLNAVGGGASWEIFDAQTLTTTNEQFKVKKYRALRGELARTITAMEMVKSAKVDLAVPEESLFIREKNAPTASVLLELNPGATLDHRQVETIQALVANSVEKMSRENVVVSDTQGNELSRPEEVDLARTELDNEARIMELRKNHRETYERTLESKIKELLEPVFLSGHVQANVSVEFDYTQREENATKYLEPVSLSSADIRRYFGNEGGIAEGIGGAVRHVGNVSDLPTTGGMSGQFVEEQIRNNKIGETATRTLYAPFKIARITAGVVVDDKPSSMTADGVILRTPLSRQDITKIEELVQGSISFNERRSDGGFDVVNVRNISFSPQGGLPPGRTIREFERTRQLRKYIEYGFWLAVLLAALIFVVRPLLSAMKPVATTRALEQVSEPGALPAEAEPGMLLAGARAAAGLPGISEDRRGEEATQGLLMQKSQDLDTEILELTKSNPKKVALVLRSWVETTT